LGGSHGKMVIWNLENNSGVRKAFPGHIKNASSTREVLQVEEEPMSDVEDVEDVNSDEE
jgi:hypothetical protein